MDVIGPTGSDNPGRHGPEAAEDPVPEKFTVRSRCDGAVVYERAEPDDPTGTGGDA
ncbi:hypothetical protein AB0J86_06640 [Micromonospora sp. NPDC049559]|uniref:hypothetical protein n=1 Tax=Micromonospora sp. NPDC049559 TaxID=3155923 RepID=UPI00343DA80E